MAYGKRGGGVNEEYYQRMGVYMAMIAMGISPQEQGADAVAAAIFGGAPSPSTSIPDDIAYKVSIILAGVRSGFRMKGVTDPATIGQAIMVPGSGGDRSFTQRLGQAYSDATATVTGGLIDPSAAESRQRSGLGDVVGAIDPGAVLGGVADLGDLALDIYGKVAGKGA